MTLNVATFWNYNRDAFLKTCAFCSIRNTHIQYYRYHRRPVRIFAGTARASLDTNHFLLLMELYINWWLEFRMKRPIHKTRFVTKTREIRALGLKPILVVR